MGCCSEPELELKKRFETTYAQATEPVMLDIEQQVCGCGYGGNSWTTRDQADNLMGLLDLRAGTALVDLGAGTGWPGIYLAQKSGCAVALVDLPEIGLRIAKDRARTDGLADRVSTLIADAADLPFPDACFDAISHSDLLCCLVSKRSVLTECRRVIRETGCMAFTVISITPGLSQSEFSRALANAPEFAETGCSYPSLLDQTGWRLRKTIDVTDEYRQSCARQIDADNDHRTELNALLGTCAADERMTNWHSKLRAIEDGLFRREIFVCLPA